MVLPPMHSLTLTSNTYTRPDCGVNHEIALRIRIYYGIDCVRVPLVNFVWVLNIKSTQTQKAIHSFFTTINCRKSQSQKFCERLRRWRVRTTPNTERVSTTSLWKHTAHTHTYTQLDYSHVYAFTFALFESRRENNTFITFSIHMNFQLHLLKLLLLLLGK